MSVRNVNYLKALPGIVALAAAVQACSDVAGGGRHPVKLSVTSKTSSAVTSVSASSGLALDLKVGSAGDLVLTRAQVVVGDMALNQSDGQNCNGEFQNGDNNTGEHEDANHEDANHEESNNDGCQEVSSDPLLVDIPLDNSVKPVLTVPLSPGTYSGLDLKVSPADDAETAFNTANPDFVGKSVRVEGTYKGKAFTFTSPLRANLETRFNPPLVIDANTKNATVNIDVASWFLDRSGNVIDPTTATPGSDTQRQIENNIRASFHAFNDDDESGVDDQHEHGGD